MNDDLRNALEQLKRRAAGQRQAMPPTPKEAQALLDERDALRGALGDLLKATDEKRDLGSRLFDLREHRKLPKGWKATYTKAIDEVIAAEERVRAIIAKTQNEET